MICGRVGSGVIMWRQVVLLINELPKYLHHHNRFVVIVVILSIENFFDQRQNFTSHDVCRLAG